MSWMCHICGTINKDETTTCTKCGEISPVIKSYLSSHTDDRTCEYGEKIKEIEAFEKNGEYERMLDAAIAAMSMQEENGQAVDKAKHAILQLSQVDLKIHILNKIQKSTGTNKNYELASALFDLLDYLGIDAPEYTPIRNTIKDFHSTSTSVNEILEESYKAIIELDTEHALKIIEDGLFKYPSNDKLLKRKEDIRSLSINLNKTKQVVPPSKSNEKRRKKFPIPIQKKDSDETPQTPSSATPTNPGNKRVKKFPSVKQ